MAFRTRHASCAALVAGTLVVVGILPLIILPRVGSPDWMGIGPVSGTTPWTDSLDDDGHVYVPESGLVGVEVAGGEAHLLPGFNSGWLASEPIVCPSDQRYDLVMLEAETPGASRVEITILDPSKDPSEVGFANETVPGFVRRETKELSVFALDHTRYPSIRVQVNLVASGTDRPRLYGWTVHFIGLDEWREEFIGRGKMTADKGLNVTGGIATINLTRKGSLGVDYPAYPTLLATRYVEAGSTSYDALYPLSDRTGYESAVTSISHSGAVGFAFDDLDTDGDVDLLLVNQRYNSANVDSQILWGTGDDGWSASSSTTLQSDLAYRGATGDIDGDGWPDVVLMGRPDSGNGDIRVFLNDGSGGFGPAPDITLTGGSNRQIGIGDLDGDGFDDIVLAKESGTDVYLSGPDGPDQTVDITYASTTLLGDLIVRDLDGDGMVDILAGLLGSTKVQVFLGGIDGPDTTADHTLTIGGGWSAGTKAGDVNGDGFLDIVNIELSPTIRVFWGSATGWSDSSAQTLVPPTYCSALEVVDLDKDGFSDIVVGTETSMHIYYGGTTLSSTADLTLSGLSTPLDLKAAVPRSSSGRFYVGSFVTETIPRPPDKVWDVAALEGGFPQGTRAVMSILDASGRAITGLRDLSATDVDLSPVADEAFLQVRVVVLSEVANTTPTLERLRVRWMDPGIWRDEFFGSAKVERVLGLEVAEGSLTVPGVTASSPQLLLSSERGDKGYGTMGTAYVDSGGLDYTSQMPISFEVTGASAVDAADVDGDGDLDVAFAVLRTSDTTYSARSPLFLGSAVGFKATPDATFPTTGASDVVMRDLDADGHADVLFAQQTPDGSTGDVDSVLYMGQPGGGWNATPDVAFATNGASGAAVADLDGDGDLDIAFACYGSPSATSTDSLVFLQGANGFCGTVPSHGLATRGARAVAAGDVDGDGLVDLAFANSFGGGSTEIDSYVYRGRAGGGFEAAPKGLRTSGAEDVKLADLDGDGDLDVVFANMRDNVPSYRVDSYVYMNGGGGAFAADPDVRLPTTGAVAVAVADLDGVGRRDLVFAGHYDGASFAVPSLVFLGGATGWSTAPDVTLPTTGATDVLADHLITVGLGGYMSRPIGPEDWQDTGAFHTFRYTASLGGQQVGTLQLLDAVDMTVLAETQLNGGAQEWVVKDEFWVKEHPTIRVTVTVTGLDGAGDFSLDDLWLNWTKRVRMPPAVVDLHVEPVELPRVQRGSLWINVTDEYDPSKVLRLVVEHRANGTSAWSAGMLGTPEYKDGAWRVGTLARADAKTGWYDLRVSVTDSDDTSSGYIEYPSALEVLNNIPTTPSVRIVPEAPVTSTSLRAEVVMPSTDVETGVTNRYMWYKDGEPVEGVMDDTVSSTLTGKGQNWSVEVRAFDGLDESAPARAWVMIRNAPPQVSIPLPYPELPEDTVDDRWLDLGRSFSDPDGDVLIYTVVTAPEHIGIAIDPTTGRVTLTPARDWHGQEPVTFAASDGEVTQTQTVLITVTPVNDAPRFTTVNGGPITSDPMDFTVPQGGLLVITVGAGDVEGDRLAFSVNTSAVEVDADTGEMRFSPGIDVVGTIRYALTMYDMASPNVKVRLNITITVTNVNDPPGEARITNPRTGDKFKANQTFSLIGACEDPDTPFGQVLNYTWYWNGTNLIGWGSSLTCNFSRAGNYTITLRVTDGEYVREASVAIEVMPKETPLPPPPPPPPPEEEGLGAIAWIGALVALVIIGGVIFLVMARKRAAEKEASDEEDEKREAYKQMAVAVKETAEEMEREVAESRAARAAAPKMAASEGIKVEGMGGPSAQAGLSMDMQLSEQASKEVAALFKDVDRREAAPPSADTEAMRLEGLKRKYQTAISRLPYGIPAAALKDRDWPWLAAAMATGEKKTTPDGREATKIEGRWYFSDVKDASSFLTEHGAKARPEPMKVVPAAAAPKVDKATLLAKLEERFILGEISEKAYEDLKRKYESLPQEPKKGGKTSEWEEAE